MPRQIEFRFRHQPCNQGEKETSKPRFSKSFTVYVTARPEGEAELTPDCPETWHDTPLQYNVGIHRHAESDRRRGGGGQRRNSKCPWRAG